MRQGPLVSRSPSCGARRADRSARTGPHARAENRRKDVMPSPTICCEMNARAGNVWNGDPIDTTPSLTTVVEMLREPPDCWIAFALLGRRADEASLDILVRGNREPGRVSSALGC